MDPTIYQLLDKIQSTKPPTDPMDPVKREMKLECRTHTKVWSFLLKKHLM